MSEKMRALADRLRQAAPMVKPTAVRRMLPAWIGEVCLQAAEALSAPQDAADAWAVSENGVLDVNSVAPTRIAAIINFLCTERGFMSRQAMSDDFILKAWDALKGTAEVDRVSVLRASPQEKTDGT